MVWKGCVETHSGTIEISLGDGPGPDRQVAGPFQKYWGCSFANQVCDLVPTKHTWSRLENTDHLLEGRGQPMKTQGNCKGSHFPVNSQQLFGRCV